MDLLLTLSVRETDGEGLGSGRVLGVVRSHFPDPAPVRANVRLKAHVGGDWTDASIFWDRTYGERASLLAWLAQTLWVLSRLITRRIFLVSLC